MSGRASYGSFGNRVHLSSQDIQDMVEQEVETVSRELVAEPSLALLDLTETKGEMDEMAMRAQVNSNEIRHDLYLHGREMQGAKLVPYMLLWRCPVYSQNNTGKKNALKLM